MHALLLALVLIWLSPAAAAGPPRPVDVVLEARRLLESDLLREQYHADLHGSMTRAEALVAGASDAQRAWALVARARVSRLRGEYADAEHDLHAADRESTDSGDPTLYAYITGERRLLAADRAADAQALQSFDALDLVKLDPVAALADIGDIMTFAEQTLAPKTGPPRTNVQLLHAGQVLSSLLYVDAVRVAEKERKAGRSLAPSLLSSGTLGRSMSLLVELFGWPPYRAAKRAFIPRSSRQCGELAEALDRLYCVGDRRTRSSVELLGLRPGDLEDAGEELILDALERSVRDPAELELLAELRREFMARGETRPLARATELEAIDAFLRFAIARDDRPNRARRLLVEARQLAVASGDTKLEAYLSGFLAMLHALEHHRKAARTEWTKVGLHARLHGDDGMLHVLGEVGAALARVQVRVRSDLAASDILFELSLSMHEQRRSRVDYILTAINQSSMYFRGNVPHKAGEGLAVALDKVGEVVRDPSSNAAERLVSIRLAQVMVEAEEQVDLEQLTQLYILLEGMYPQRPANENFEELYYVDIAARAAGEMLEREFSVNHEELTTVAVERARALIVQPGLSPERWPEMHASLRASLGEVYANVAWYFDAITETSNHLVEVGVRQINSMLYAEITYRQAQRELLENPDQLPRDFHAEARNLEWRLSTQQPVLHASILRARGDLEGARAALLEVAWMWKQVLADRPSREQLTLLRTYFAMLVEFDAYQAADEYLAALLEHGGPGWYRDPHLDWRALAAWIRLRSEQDGAAQAWPLVEIVERELGPATAVRDPRLRRGVLNQRSLARAVMAAVDVALALGEHETATNLIAAAQPSIFAMLSRDGDGELVDIATMYDMLSSTARSPDCTADSSCVAELDLKRRNLEARYEALLPKDVRDFEPVPELTLNVPANTAIVTWLLSDYELRVVVWRRDHPVMIESREVDYLRLRGRTQRLGTALTRGLSDTDTDPDLEQLAAALLPSPSQLAGVDRIVLVPSDIVADVPFALLPWAGSRLGLQFVLSESPTLDAATKLDFEARAGIGRARVLYDPFESGARTEGRALAGVLRSRSKRASKDAFIDALSTRDLVHVTAHGRASNQGQPSALVLGDGLFTTEDAWLLEGELRARRVVFSACEVGAAHGSLDNDGFRIGMALLGRGVEEVVVPLWQIEDSRRTLSFWRLFYRHLRRHRSMSEALHHAQREAAMEGLPRWVWGAYKVISGPPTR